MWICWRFTLNSMKYMPKVIQHTCPIIINTAAFYILSASVCFCFFRLWFYSFVSKIMPFFKVLSQIFLNQILCWFSIQVSMSVCLSVGVCVCGSRVIYHQRDRDYLPVFWQWKVFGYILPSLIFSALPKLTE